LDCRPGHSHPPTGLAFARIDPTKRCSTATVRFAEPDDELPTANVRAALATAMIDP
jgi:hypothetical protein